MSERVPTSADPSTPTTQRYRALAEQCRAQARIFRDSKARTQMLQLAANYDRKAVQAEAFEIKEAE